MSEQIGGKQFGKRWVGEGGKCSRIKMEIGGREKSTKDLLVLFLGST